MQYWLRIRRAALLAQAKLPPTNPAVITPSQAAAQSGPPRSAFTELAARADAARDANQLDDAAALYRKALALRPSWAEGWWNLGTILYDGDDYTQAAAAFRKAADLDPKSGMAKIMLGLCEFELGDDASAPEHLEEGKRLGLPKDPQMRHVMLYHEGVLLARRGGFGDAQLDFQALCKEGVQSDDLTEALGRVALRIQAPNVPETPDGEAVTRGVGWAECLAAANQFDEARRDFGDLTEKYPSYPGIHYAFGKFLLEAHDTTAATREFEAEIKNDPKQVMARLEIAAVKYRVDSAAGLPYAEEAVKLDPQLPFGHYLLGLLLVDTHHDQRAIPELEIARRAFPRELSLYYALGEAYSRVGNKQEAERARATFARLSQQAGNKSQLTYYGQEPSGTTNQPLGGEPVTPH